MNSEHETPVEPSSTPKTKISIRRIDGAKEKELLIALQKRILPGDEPDPVEHGFWWIAKTDTGLPVGFCALKPSSKWSDTMYLSRSGVLWAFRGQGFQKRFIRVRERFAKELGMNWLISDTYFNPPSSNSLIKCGFKLFQPTEPWGFKTALYWRKRISKPTSKES